MSVTKDVADVVEAALLRAEAVADIQAHAEDLLHRAVHPVEAVADLQH